LIGVVLIVFGVSMLALVDSSRRLISMLNWPSTGKWRIHFGESRASTNVASGKRSGGLTRRPADSSQSLGGQLVSNAARGARWFLGR
jgi:hypothetical protein